MTILVEGLCPLLTQTVLNQCHAAKLRTVTDFVICDPEDLAKKIKVPYKDVLSIRHSLIMKYAAYPQNAESLHYALLDSLSLLDTGSERLNRFLTGGIYTGEVTEIYGSAGSGKTQFCFSLISKLILESHSTAIYLDTSNNFDGKRMEQILLQKSGKDRAIIQQLHNVKVKNIYNIYEFFDFLDTLKTELCKKESVFFRHLKLLIIDSITPLLSPCFGGMFLDGPGILNNVSQQFKALCTDYMLSILVCNNAVSDKILSVKPALGPNWKYVPSVSLCIAKCDSTNYKMSTLKSCRNGLFGQASFRITEAGVTD